MLEIEEKVNKLEVRLADIILGVILIVLVVFSAVQYSFSVEVLRRLERIERMVEVR